MRPALGAALLFMLGCAQPAPPPERPPIDPRTPRALEIYAKYPPERAEQIWRRWVDSNGNPRPILSPDERDFLDPEIHELWKLGRAIAEQHQVPDLVKQLHSEKSADRDFATRMLKDFGTIALPDLEKAEREIDPEFVGRVKAIIVSIHAAARPPLDPDAPGMKTQAPDLYKVRFTTSQGDFTVTVHRRWAPLGADRFYNLVRGGFYNNASFFRVIHGFMAQFGIHGDPAVSARWREARIPDDPVVESNKRGRITFATAGPNTRTTQLFINYNDRNARLDAMGFAPFGEVTEGMDIVDRLYVGYGEGAPSGKGPEQEHIQSEGTLYLRTAFPNLDYILTAALVD